MWNTARSTHAADETENRSFDVQDSDTVPAKRISIPELHKAGGLLPLQWSFDIRMSVCSTAFSGRPHELTAWKGCPTQQIMADTALVQCAGEFLRSGRLNGFKKMIPEFIKITTAHPPREFANELAVSQRTVIGKKNALRLMMHPVTDLRSGPKNTQTPTPHFGNYQSPIAPDSTFARVLCIVGFGRPVDVARMLLQNGVR